MQAADTVVLVPGIHRTWCAAIVAAIAAVTVLTTAPGAGAVGRVESASIAVIGDFGSGSSDERRVADLIRRVGPEAVVTTGDNVYSNAGYQRLVGDYYAPWVGSGRFLAATGNHDHAEGIEAFDAYFAMPSGRRWTSRTIGGIEFFVLDSEAMLQSSGQFAQQRAWLARELPRSTADWQVVVLHHPPYSSGSVHGSTLVFRWPFARWGADLVLSGHDHDYERLRVGGLTYIVNGSGGRSLYRFARPLPGSIARNSTDFGALFLTATPNSLTGRFVADSGRGVDRFEITSPGAGERTRLGLHLRRHVGPPFVDRPESWEGP